MQAERFWDSLVGEKRTGFQYILVLIQDPEFRGLKRHLWLRKSLQILIKGIVILLELWGRSWESRVCLVTEAVSELLQPWSTPKQVGMQIPWCGSDALVVSQCLFLSHHNYLCLFCWRKLFLIDCFWNAQYRLLLRRAGWWSQVPILQILYTVYIYSIYISV